MLELITRISKDDVTIEADDRLTLPYALRQRSRQRVVLESGRKAGLFLPPRGSVLDGDQLRSEDGVHVVVGAARELLSDARAEDPLLFARACYHLGNRHVSLQVGPGWLRYEPDHVLDEMVRRLGLSVDTVSAPFEPERGAYHGHGRSDSHAHQHEHPHADERQEERQEQAPIAKHGKNNGDERIP